MKYRISLYRDGQWVTTKVIRSLDEIQDWMREWKGYSQLKGEWEVRIGREVGE